MVPSVFLGCIGKGYFVIILIAITRLQTTKGLPEIEINSTCFCYAVPLDQHYTTVYIIVTPHNCINMSAIVELANCTLERAISEFSKFNSASSYSNSDSSYIRIDPSLKSSGPVDVFIRLHSVLLRVPPINQRTNSYLFRPLNQTRNENCEKLFIYAVNDSATLNICSNEFLQINMSSPSDHDIIKQEVSRKCFKKTVSLDDGLLLSGLSRIARLQITSDQPVGILYGLDLSSMPNRSSNATDESDEGLAGWHILPISSMMGKLFVIVPCVRFARMHAIIIGFKETVVQIQTPEKETVYNVTADKTLTITLKTNETIIIEASDDIIVHVTVQRQNHTSSYFAEPFIQFDAPYLNDFENTNNDEGTVSFNMDAMDNTNLTALCTDQNVNITSDNTRLTPWRIESYAVFGNKSIFIYHYEMTSTNINQIKYPKSKCFIPSCSPSALSILRVRKRTTKSVLIQNYTVIDLKSVSKTKTGSTKLFGQATSAAKYMSNVILRQTNSYNDTTTESFITGGYVKTEPKLSKILKRTDVESTLSAKVNTLQATDQDNKEDIIGPRSSFAAANAVSVATSGSLSSKPNQISGVTESKVSATHTPLDVIQYPMQDQMNLPTDINEGFKIAVDIVQLDEKTHLQSGTDNPPYVVKSDVFVSMESDLDARNSMAVIISLSAALAAVMLVILVFFLTEVFSRRRYIRNIRIRPSRSFY